MSHILFKFVYLYELLIQDIESSLSLYLLTIKKETQKGNQWTILDQYPKNPLDHTTM